MLRIRKLRHIKFKLFSQGHIASKWWNQALNPGNLGFTDQTFNLLIILQNFMCYVYNGMKICKINFFCQVFLFFYFEREKERERERERQHEQGRGRVVWGRGGRTEALKRTPS